MSKPKLLKDHGVMSDTDIAKLLGVTRQAVHLVRKRAEAKIRKAIRRDLAFFEEVREMVNLPKGLSG